MNLNTTRLLLFLLFFAPILAHAAVTVENLRQWRAPDHTRLVFDLSAPLEHRVFTLADPHRIVVDMQDARLAGQLPTLDFTGPLLANVRSGRPEPGTLRIVLDLKVAVEPRTFVLGPIGQYGHRLVIDLLDSQAALQRERAPRRARPRDTQPFVVAIDAGHGGEDPGALGRRYRTREKDVTLAIARELARMVDRAPGMRALLTRDGDYYVGLRERFDKARAHHADVFISIHADAVPGRQASGASVYALSQKGATDVMSRVLAERENRSDLIGGVKLSDVDDDALAKTLLDLTQTRTIQDSLVLGGDLLAELDRIGPLHTDYVRQAGFMVLKAPDIPSVLVETAFISNPAEERKLRSRRYQRQIAEGIYRGILRYQERLPGLSPALAQTGTDPGATRSF